MRVITYNLLNPFHALKYTSPGKEGVVFEGEQKKDNWITRKHEVISNLKLADFTIALLQEVSKDTLEDLSKEFTIAGYSTHKSSTPESEHGVAILYRKESIDLLNLNTFQSLKGGKYDWRGELYADFFNKSNGLKYRVASTHLKGYDPYDSLKKKEGRREGFLQLKEMVKNVESDPPSERLIIGGDLNEDANELLVKNSNNRLHYLQELGYLFDGDLSGTENNSYRKIDWIFGKGVKLQHLFLNNQSLTASDHKLSGSLIF